MKTKLLLLLFTVQTLWGAERIIALSPAINEIIFALDAGEQVVGNTDYSLYPEDAKKLPKVGGFFAPSLEKIVALQPTLVIMQRNNPPLSLKLKQLNINTKIIEIDTLQHIKQSITDIGTLLHKSQEAQMIVEEINNELQKLKNIISDKKIPIVFGNNLSLDKNVFVAGQNLYYDEIINQSNNTNALHSKRKGEPILNMENIIAINPDIVLLLARCQGDEVSEKALLKPWRALPITATNKDAFYINRHIYAGIPSNRIVLFLKDFRHILEDYKEKIKESHATN